MKSIAIAVLMSIILAGCASMGHYSGSTARDIDVNGLAFMLNDSLRRPALKNKEIGVISFANLNNLEQVEPLGRHIQERLSHALFDLGFRIVEIRQGNKIFFKPMVGELNLSRLKEKLKRTEFSEIKSLIMGTYFDAGDFIYVRSQLIDLETSLIRASGEIKIRKGEYLSKLLKIDKKKKPLKQGVYERFPSQNKTKEDTAKSK
jgi:FlgO protein